MSAQILGLRKDSALCVCVCLACNVDRDLLLYDVLQTQHHAKLALHLLPVGSTFCQVAHGL